MDDITPITFWDIAEVKEVVTTSQLSHHLMTLTSKRFMECEAVRGIITFQLCKFEISHQLETSCSWLAPTTTLAIYPMPYSCISLDLSMHYLVTTLLARWEKGEHLLMIIASKVHTMLTVSVRIPEKRAVPLIADHDLEPLIMSPDTID